MFGLAKASFAGAAYLIGAATGVALTLPLAAVAFTPERGPAPVAMHHLQGPVASQASLVNRASKGSRLDVVTPAQSRPMPTPSPSLARETEPKPVIMQPPRAPSGAAPAAMPRGCLSALGGIRPNIPTENLTVCIADISGID